ncbi:hypothetical protein B005_2065 [Nocardiopsis alba ATCC BAA-2165]|uniref:Uncharacterized protein n=1 Tax=Nocardiopsis alba (strain ATCC BAA-2165 / BE74) TaxID=1205910 RepID=J7LH17_NOCAA|nr:hypothetical protein B005_2065 [Nocardiopsis alba ATCC BAA-2165]
MMLGRLSGPCVPGPRRMRHVLSAVSHVVGLPVALLQAWGTG